VRRDDAGTHVSVNLRAPLFVDTRNHVARQYVMPNSKYPVRHSL
jgi:flagellar assembly factor FliW